jgi:hypothetical protein
MLVHRRLPNISREVRREFDTSMLCVCPLRMKGHVIMAHLRRGTDKYDNTNTNRLSVTPARFIVFSHTFSILSIINFFKQYS